MAFNSHVLLFLKILLYYMYESLICSTKITQKHLRMTLNNFHIKTTWPNNGKDDRCPRTHLGRTFALFYFFFTHMRNVVLSLRNYCKYDAKAAKLNYGYVFAPLGMKDNGYYHLKMSSLLRWWSMMMWLLFNLKELSVPYVRIIVLLHNIRRERYCKLWRRPSP